MKRSVNKLWIFALFSIMMLTPVCLGYSVDNNVGPATLKIMTYYSTDGQAEAMSGFFKYFQSLYPNIKIENINPGEGETFRTKQRQAMAAGTVDLISMQAGSRVNAFAREGVALDITSMWDSNNYDKLGYRICREIATYEGRIYTVPLMTYLYGVTYPKEMFSRLGLRPPKTWNDFLEVCQKLKDNGITPFAIGLKDQWPITFLWDFLIERTAGKEFVERLYNGKESWTDPKVFAAAELLKQLADKGYFIDGAASYDHNGAFKLLAEGKASMWVGGDWAWQGMVSLGFKGPGQDLDWFEFPTIDPKVPVGMLDVPEGFVICAKTKYPDAAKLFLDTFARDVSALAPWCDLMGASPFNIEASKKIKASSPQIAELASLQRSSYAFVDTSSKMDAQLQQTGWAALANIVLTRQYKSGLAELQKQSASVFKNQ